jgi:type VI secretion system Hcp family effector
MATPQGTGVESVLVKVQGITGESQVHEHVGWMGLAGFEWGGTRVARSTMQGSFGTSRKSWAPQLRSVILKRVSDAQSAVFWAHLIQRRTIADVKIDWLRTGPSGKPIAYFAVELTKVEIVRISEESSGEQPIEVIELKYEMITLGVRNVGNSLTGQNELVQYMVPTHIGG